MAVGAVIIQGLALYWPRGVETPAEVAGLHLDKLAHIALFAFASWALLRVWPAWLAVGLMVVQVVVSEGVQGMFLAERSADPWDAAADLVGIALGWWFVRFGPAADPAPGRRAA